MNEDKRIALRARAKDLLDIRRGLDLKLKHLGDQRNEIMTELREIERELINGMPMSAAIYVGGGRG